MSRIPQRILVLFFLGIIGNLSYAQDRLGFGLHIAYAPDDFFISESDWEFQSHNIHDAIRINPVLNFDVQYDLELKNSESFVIFGLGYTHIRAKSVDHEIDGVNPGNRVTIESNDKAIRNYLIPKVGMRFNSKISRKTFLNYGALLNFGMPFWSKNIVNQRIVDPFHGFIDNSGNLVKVPKYTGASFTRGLLYGIEVFCQYSIQLNKNMSGSHLSFGPDVSLFKLHSANDLKYSIGIKAGLDLMLE